MSKSHVADRASEPTSAQFKELFAQVESGRITREKLQDFLRGQEPNFPTYSVSVNHDLTVEQLIRAGGYDWVNGDITSSHYPLAKKGIERVDISVIPTGNAMSTPAVLKMLGQFGFRRPNIKEGLSLGVTYPDLQRESPIVILCEPWSPSHRHMFVPYLDRHDSFRHLNLTWFEDDWNSYWRFAAVRQA